MVGTRDRVAEVQLPATPLADWGAHTQHTAHRTQGLSGGRRKAKTMVQGDGS